jgi:putative Ca2+/H+ antiporter (TMEM165/GDT1 family)
VLGAAGAFFIAELGDKTQLLTMTIAADPGAAGRSLPGLAGLLGPAASGPAAYVAVWAGSTVGMLVINGLAALAGTALGSRLSPRLIKRVSGVVFIGFGVLMIASQVL